MSTAPGITDNIPAFLATHYMSGVALTISLWDHFLNVDQEIELVWRQSWSVLQTVVLVNRYGGEVSLLFIAYTMAGFGAPLTASMLVPGIKKKIHELIHVLVAAGSLLYSVSTGLLQVPFTLLLRATLLWDNKRSIKYALICGFAIGLSISITFASLVEREIQSGMDVLNSRGSRTCIIESSSWNSQYAIYYAGVWGGMLFYDIYVMTLLIINALNRPRRHNSKIMVDLYKDGALTFLAFFTLRLVQFIPSVFGNLSVVFLTPLTAWSLDSVLGYHFLLRMKRVEVASRCGWRPVVNEHSVFVMEEIEVDCV
ncbi:uncharacterized protein FIBRA_00761 [Fibroporia radiculosa]|uniref:DUF6533 domain-containing protein n=1 Tax=Fibroporia radiculosa TaxID=599839 RepID=J4I842_9APHY|nr:uncharacterized protein FIBRA_00761 [Fibroporia radiculosa]CCL98756.1 predicted protein [Fibroporia radiculosa]